MLLIDNQEYFDKVKQFAEQTGRAALLQKELDYLDKYACPEDDPTKTVCVLYYDSAPQSFYFVMLSRDLEKFPAMKHAPEIVKTVPSVRETAYKRWFNGGLIFHGDHDGHGSGSAPTFAVTLTPTDGWSIHT